MNEKRSPAPLVIGLVLIAVGGIFLAANVFDLRLRWGLWLEFVPPILLLFWGLVKLARHFSWDASRLGQAPLKGGLLGGLFWTAVGTVWLLDLFDLVNGVALFGLYWPLLVVLFGIGKIVDYYRFHGQSQFRAGEILGLLFLALTGVLANAAAEAHFPLLRFPIELGDNDSEIRIGDYLGPKYSWTTTTSVTFPPDGRLEVSNSYGNVSIEEGASDSVEIRLTKEVFESSESEARRLADQIEIRSESVEGVLRVGTNRDQIPPSRSRFNSHLSLSIPKSASLRIVNEYGDVQVRNLHGPVEVENSYGEVEVEDVETDVAIKNRYRRSTARRVGGNLKIDNQRGEVSVEEVSGSVQLSTERDSINANGVGGAAVVRNRFSSISLENVEGTVRVDGQGSGVTLQGIGQDAIVENSYRPFQANNLKGGLELDTSNCGVTLARISGPVTIRANQAKIEAGELEAGIVVQARGSEVRLTEIEGGFKVATSLRSVSIDGFSGKGEVQNEYGEIELSSSEALEAPLDIANKNGAIRLRLPSDANFKLSAQAPGGSIDSQFNPRAEAVEAAATLEASIGRGGPLVRLQTTYGPIQVEKN